MLVQIISIVRRLAISDFDARSSNGRRMTTVFDEPQWSWRRAYQKNLVLGMRNAVKVCLPRGTNKTVLVEIPTAFIKYVDDVHGDVDLSTVRLFLDEYADICVFGYTIKGEPYDLWTYKRRGLPAWINFEVNSDARS